jgi:hypothetical protein
MSQPIGNNVFEFSNIVKVHFFESIDNINTKYYNYIDVYSYLYIGLLPIYIYENPYFIINNLSNPFITLCCMAYLLNRVSNIIFLLAPVVFLIDRINHFRHDSIIYMIVFIALFTIVQMIYLVSYTTRSLLNDPNFISECERIDNMTNNNIINEPVETENTESADETEQSDSADENENTELVDETEPVDEIEPVDETELSDSADENENIESVDETNEEDMSDLPELI